MTDKNIYRIALVIAAVVLAIYGHPMLACLALLIVW